MKLTITALAICGLLTAASASAQVSERRLPPSDPAQTVKLDIGPQSLGTALNEFGRQTGLHVVLYPELVAGLATRGVKGAVTAQDGLNMLLIGTGLRYEYLDSQTISIKSAAADREAVTSEAGAMRLARAAQAQADALTKVDTADSGGAQKAANATQAAEDSTQEVVVTAQKRLERLQDVPISMTVLSGRKLDHSTAQGLTELLNTVPGVAAFQYQQGGGSNVSIRGVSASNPVNNGSSPVSYYLDSVPFGFVRMSFAPETNAYDLDRVEVLRGPQGTLYGASALNGVVRVLSKDADLNEFELKSRVMASSTEGGAENYRGDLAINVPIIDEKLAGRAVASYQDLSGWIDKPNDENANDADIRTLRLKISARPVDRLSLGASLWSSRQRFGATANGDSNARSSNLLPEPNDIDVDVFGGRIVYEFPAVSVAATSGYLTYQSHNVYQFLPGVPTSRYDYEIESKVFSQEVNLTSTTEGAWRWTAGGIYRDGRDNTSALIPLISVRTLTDLGSESYAAFGEITRQFAADKLELTAGLRYFHDDVFLTNLVTTQHVESSFHSTTPRAVLTWHSSADLTVYASYAQGFRSGAPQSVGIVLPTDFPAVKPDKLTNYELGAKGEVLGGRVSFETALYYMYWKDTQQALTVPFGPNNTPFFALVNAPSASGVGVDFGISVRPADGLTLGANVAWNDLTVDENVISSGAVLFTDGDRLSLSPEYTASGTLDYAFPIGSGGYAGQFSASINYTSEQAQRTVVSNPLPPRAFIASGETSLIGRTSFSVSAPGGWTVTAFADNVTDENGTIYASPFAGVRLPESDGRPRPRTIGLQLEYSFGN